MLRNVTFPKYKIEKHKSVTKNVHVIKCYEHLSQNVTKMFDKLQNLVLEVKKCSNHIFLKIIIKHIFHIKKKKKVQNNQKYVSFLLKHIFKILKIENLKIEKFQIENFQNKK